ncbi:MAG: restriction endonuclease subunit S [Candidatus Scalindua sp.]|nr:restriction endonuclease subunit S [Candidatus Scalindua sp.]
MSIICLKDVIAKLESGSRPKGGASTVEGIPSLGAEHLSYEGRIVFDKPKYVAQNFFDQLSSGILKDQDVLIVKDGATTGKVAIWMSEFEKACINEHVFRIEIDSDKALPKYIFYFLISSYGNNQVLKDFRGATVGGISRSFADKVRMYLPSLSDQKQIVQILDTAETLRQKRREQIKLLDDYLKSVFFEMFGDPRVKTRWDMIDFGKVIDILTDYHANGSYEILRNHVELKSTPDYALMVRTTDLENNNFTDDVKYISKEAYEFLEKSKVYGGEIIINKIGSAGNVYLMPHLNKPVSLGMPFLLRFNEFANTIFIYHLLTSEYGKCIIDSKVKGAVTKTIRKDAIRSLRIPLPPIGLQNKFASIVELAEQTKQKMHESLDEMNNHFNALMQRYFG